MIEVLIDENMDDAKQCAHEVIENAVGHYYCCDGTIDLKIIDVIDD